MELFFRWARNCAITFSVLLFLTFVNSGMAKPSDPGYHLAQDHPRGWIIGCAAVAIVGATAFLSIPPKKP